MVGIMGRDVKKEMEKPEAVSSVINIPAAVVEEEENLTLAHLSQTRDSARKSGEKNEKLSNVEKRFLDRKMKQALSGSGRKLTSFEHYNGANHSSHSPGEFKSSAVIRALEVRLNMAPEFPSFVKSLVRSHVASCFWMGLPGGFCKSHLPDKDVSITLEDESGKHYQVKYIAYKTGLSAGWRQFSVAHKLVEGDALIFQFIKPTKFKNLAYKSEEAIDARRYIEGRTERDLAEDEMRIVEEKLAELKQACRRFDAAIANLNSKAGNYELEFLKEAKAPW